MKKLSILIPTTPDREKVLYELLSELHDQLEDCNVVSEIEILVEEDNRELSVGKKRQILMERSKGEFIVYIDDDDSISKDYISSIMEAIKQNPDVIGFEGFMTTDGKSRENFKISKDFLYITIQDSFGKKEYLRHNNHLSPIKREIALQIGFKDMRFGEDYDYALRLKQSGLIKTEIYIPKDLYHYKYITKK